MPINPGAVAVFDFDGTLTHTDSFLPFLRHAAGRWAFFNGMARLAPAMARFALRRMPNHELKERFLSAFLGGRDLAAVRTQAMTFSKRRLPSLLNSEAMEKLHWHRTQGHRIILLSASPELYLEVWARDQGIEEVLGTKLETQGGRLTGRLVGENCHGEAKVRRLTEHLGDLSTLVLYGYGDSRADLPLLSRCAHPAFRSFERRGLTARMERLFLFCRSLI